jgi:hypothetical protein
MWTGCETHWLYSVFVIRFRLGDENSDSIPGGGDGGGGIGG